MRLEQEISQSLYRAIRDKYEAGQYRDAVLAATQHLWDLLRSRTDFDRLTESEIGPLKFIEQTLGSAAPKIPINAGQTLSEISEQAGWTYLVMGIFQGVRVPRIHSEMDDSETTANAIIVFIDYLASRIEPGTNAYR
ncbi:MAG: hypothetical protein OHK0037_22750 [Elainellaceae cyanobacterium]